MCKQIQFEETEVGYKMHVLTGMISRGCNCRQEHSLAMKLILHSASPGSSLISLVALPSVGPLICWTTNCRSNTYTCPFIEKVGPTWYFGEIFLKNSFKYNPHWRPNRKKKYTFFVHTSKIALLYWALRHISFHFLSILWWYTRVRGNINLWIQRMGM